MLPFGCVGRRRHNVHPVWVRGQGAGGEETAALREMQDSLLLRARVPEKALEGPQEGLHDVATAQT